MSTRDLAISVRGLSKSYTIVHDARKHVTLAEACLDRLRHPLTRPQREEFWALRGASFEVKKGEVLGIIGRNGAGKSTLLKILSRITEPTAGEVDLYGRVGSLLEVGTGFHPELTGRENIYLNGHVLGMPKRDVQGQFDAIVDFAGVEQFLDTPVKRYSSGMYVRLAFAVAAHLNPDILLVDEVLAVGDAEFQKKCLGKMQDVVRKHGRTVLFVSHNMGAVRELCTTGLLLRAGVVAFYGDTVAAVEHYLSAGTDGHASEWHRESPPVGALTVQRVVVELRGEQPEHELTVDVELRTVGKHAAAFIAVDIFDATGTPIMQALPTLRGFINDRQSCHHVVVEITLPPLVPGRYDVSVWVGTHNIETLDEVKRCARFEVHQTPTAGRTFPHTPDHGYIVPASQVRYRAGAERAPDGQSEDCGAAPGGAAAATRFS